MNSLHYIGVSGMGSREQQTESLNAFEESGLRELGRTMLIGVKATTRIQVDETEASRGSNWYPVGDSLRKILRRSDSVNALQLYADDWTDLSERALPLMNRSIERSEDWLDGLQFDMLPWFEEDSSLQIIKQYAPKVAGPVILQCYGDIMRSQPAEAVIERLRHVEGFVSHVLFDASEGRGELMDPDALCVWVEALQASDLDMAPVIAGGLSAESVRTLLPAITRRFDDVSWDAESSLHTDDVLDTKKVAEYFTASTEVLRSK
ncbi:hypothetical protein KC974_04235 [Candidatus Saccharibacteria bacterium]|nr:hypothetical protein [Candidatus Saccharibacteria bacterium]